MNEPAGRRRQRGGRGADPGISAGTEDAADLVGRIRDGAAEVTRAVATQAAAAAGQLKQAAGEATHFVADTVRDRTQRAFDRQVEQVVAQAARVGEVAAQTANALRAVKADQVAEYVDGASRRAGQVAEYLEDHTVTEIMRDANDVARRHRAVAVGGMLVAGFALSRFLKASASRTAAATAAAATGELAADDESDEDADADHAADDADDADEMEPVAADEGARRNGRSRRR